MLSYQHAYHAGNLADLHKHALLAVALARLTDKPKPLTYMETHAGRGLYDLASPEAARTQEAAAGIDHALSRNWFAPDHPLRMALEAVRAIRGSRAYPGSPLIAGHFLRPGDRAELAELHPAEHAALVRVAPFARIHQQDGFQMANALLPPTPRRGFLLIDPSYEVKSDYDRVPDVVARLARKWNVGGIAVWYPILVDERQAAMAAALAASHPSALASEVRFPPAKPGHGMIGSGLFVVNPPFGLSDEAARLSALYARLGR